MKHVAIRPSAWIPNVIVALSFLFAAAGCGTAPLEPPAASGGGTPYGAYGPEVLKVNADGTTQFVAMPGALLAPAPALLGPEPVFDPARQLSVSARIDGAVGGRMICGLYVLTFPAGVFDGVATVTMTMPDSTLMLCDLEVLPADLNDFKEPVRLDLHTTTTDADLDSLQIYWWDEDKSEWIDMGCQKSADMERVFEAELLTTESATGVRLDLNHFSRYATGKAGW